jgi:hypothetical protein
LLPASQSNLIINQKFKKERKNHMACAVAGASEGLASGTGAAVGTSGMAAGGTAIGASAVGDVAAEGVVTRSEVAGEVSAAAVARLAFEEDLGEAAAVTLLGAARISRSEGGKDGVTGVFASLRAYAGFCRLSQLPTYVSRMARFNLQ